MEKLRSLFEFSLYQIFAGLIRFFPRKIILFLGRETGRLFFHLSRKHHNIALKNLYTALGKDKTPSEIENIAKLSFQHFGKTFLDMIYLAQLKPEKRNSYLIPDGLENLQTALDKGKGVLLLSAHFGLWEIISAILSKAGKLKVVARPLDNPLMEKELLKLRNALGAMVISKYHASRNILQALRKNEIVAILIDQNVLREESVFVDFFSKKASTTPGLAMFHLRTEAAIIPAFCCPTRDNKYIIKILKPVEVPLSDDSQTNILNITQACTKVIEEQIRVQPESWLWFHDRWKSRPK